MNFWRFANYLSTTTSSQLTLNPTAVNESWIVTKMVEYLGTNDRRHHYEFNQFRPAEFASLTGVQRNLDLAGYYKSGDTSLAVARSLTEVKFMREGSADWLSRIMKDFFRLISVRDRTTAATKRLLVVVGRDKLWETLDHQHNSVFSKLCPMRFRGRVATAGLTARPCSTSFSPHWRARHEPLLDDYLVPLMPNGVRVQLVGLHHCPPSLGEDAEGTGITTRIWRLIPRRR